LKDCASLIKTDSIRNCDNHIDNNKYQLYVNIILAIYDPEVEDIKGLTSFNHLISALKIPVFTSEVNKMISNKDVNILIFIHLMKAQNNDASISKFVKDALSHRVVTSEVHI